MSNIGIFSDIHYGINNNNVSKIEECDKYINWICGIIKERNLSHIFFLGDWFHNRNTLNVKVLNHSFKSLKKLNELTKIYLVVGNHDSYLKSSTEIHSLSQYNSLKNVHILSKLSTIKLFNNELLIIPWNTDYKKIQKQYDYILGHLDVEGISINNRELGGVITKNKITSFAKKKTISGHIHIRQTYNTKNGELIYIGNPFEQDWNDYQNTKGFHILDVEKNKLEFIENVFSPKHIKIYYSELKNINLKDIGIKDNYIKLIVDTKYSYNDVLDTTKEIKMFNPNSIETEYIYSTNDELIDDVEFKQTDVSHIRYMEKFIETLSFDNKDVDKDYLLELIHKYYKIAKESDTKCHDKIDININKIQIQNFKSIGKQVEININDYKNLTFISGQNKDVEGSNNGSGKTAIFCDAILFGLFGKTLKNTKNLYLVNRAVLDLDSYVKVYFTVNDIEYITKTSINKNSISCNLYKDSESKENDISKSSNKLTKQYIEEEILHCDYDMFKNQIIISESQYHNIYDITKKDKKEYIESIFNMQIFGKVLELIRKDKCNVNRELLRLHDQHIHNKNLLVEYKEKRDDFKKIGIDVINELRKKILFNQKCINNLKLNLTYEERKFIDDNSNIIEYEKKYQKIKNAIIKIENIIKRKENNLQYLYKDINKYKQIIEVLCNKCNDNITKKFNIDANKEEINSIKGDVNKYRNKLSTLLDTDIILKNRIAKLLKNEIKIREINRVIEDNNITKSHIIKDIERLNERIEENKNYENPFVLLYKNAETIVKDSNKKIKEYINEKIHLEISETITDNEGAKKYILQDIAKTLNTLIRENLKQLGANFTVLLDAEFSATFLTETGECDYNNFSSGESQRIKLSTLFAIKDMLEVNSINCNVLMIDEIMKNLDSSSVLAVVQILQKMSINKKVFLISHKKELIDLCDSYFDNIIIVQKENNQSTIL